MSKPDTLNPNLTLLSKLASIVVHAEEFCSPRSHAFDEVALRTLLKDPEVREWIEAMGVFAPVKREP